MNSFFGDDEFDFTSPALADVLKSSVSATLDEVVPVFRSIRSAAKGTDRVPDFQRAGLSGPECLVEPIRAYRLRQFHGPKEQALCVVMAASPVEAARKLGCLVADVRPLE